MVVVPVELGSLVLVHRVLDGQRVQAELLDQDLQVGLVRQQQVEPHDSPLDVEVIAHPGDVEALLDQLAVAVGPGVGVAARP